jgi:hypothetical protein
LYCYVHQYARREKVHTEEEGNIVCYEYLNLCNEELHDLYLPNIVMIISLRRMGWVGHMADMGGKRAAYRVLVGK